ncbi:restriction endonuclease subunit S [Peptostreptococcus anaerobius]|uniref:restriction endonuclease subunit S n=1 Tax=Peptostreptococcus anaerobius TaxID=1261 RepID=UPI00232F4606|nr:restriction endonuclease subunit S [Peptostreptococcus anaerobius]MDB8849406.1 restriction endonuclease subunit S [Peptostreptococcus anaerobius]MDB8853157.1 restriction endonuclease subunit S [Peptostreptococcus anaerobius]MDB8855035.1 restriction endonuclease subunit S [Peptostreptococcus anaerobius]
MNGKKKEERRVPKLRFPGFTEDWEQRKLGEIADIVGGGTPSTGNPSYWNGEIDWYAPAEIADQIYVNSSQKKITDLGYENSSAKMLPPGTVLFTSRAGIGKTAILTRKGCTNQGFQSIVPHRGELDTYFIFSRTEELKRYGKLVGAGSTFVEVSGKQMAVIELMMPPTMREQQTIGCFFQRLDNLITLHQRKLEDLKEMKKGLLQKMFPKNNEKVPELRFPGFTEDWEQRKLNEICDYTSSSLTASSSIENGKYILYDANTEIGSVDSFSMAEDYITVIKDGAGVGRIRKLPKNTAFIGTMGALTSKNKKTDFLYYLLEKKDLSKQFTGSTIPHIYFRDYGKDAVCIPKDKEQQVIGVYFKQFDNLITLHQRKLDHLKELKKGLLQQMFV